MITENNGVIMYGRSDATLNPGGVRIGTSEIYSALDALPEVDDSLAVGQEWAGDERVILFVKLSPGHVLNEELMKKLRTQIRTSCSPRHMPAKIISIEDVPYTINGKKVEIAVKKIIKGQDVGNRDALRNPGSLDLFKDLYELRS